MEAPAVNKSEVPVSFVRELQAGQQVLRVNEGEPVEMVVELSGTPPFTVLWVHNDVALADSPEFRQFDHGNGRYSLRMRDPFVADSGVYFCEAYNRFGEAETWCRLIVTDPSVKR